MRDNLPEMLRTAAKEWREENKVVGVGETRYDIVLEEAADAIEEFAIIQEECKGYILAPQEEYDGLKRKYVVLKSDTGEIVENCFVLRPDKDKAAIAALLAYADATNNQVLAKDIRAWISIISAEEAAKV